MSLKTVRIQHRAYWQMASWFLSTGLLSAIQRVRPFSWLSYGITRFLYAYKGNDKNYFVKNYSLKFSDIIYSYVSNIKKCFSDMCGYDFREASAEEPEEIRFDYNGTYRACCHLHRIGKFQCQD